MNLAIGIVISGVVTIIVFRRLKHRHFYSISNKIVRKMNRNNSSLDDVLKDCFQESKNYFTHEVTKQSDGTKIIRIVGLKTDYDYELKIAKDQLGREWIIDHTKVVSMKKSPS